MNALFQAHSGLRYLVLLVAVVVIALLFAGWSSRRAYGRQARVGMAVFTGLLDLQLLLGIVLVAMGTWYGALMGHLVMMFLAVLAAHGLSAYARGQADPRRAHAISLAGVVLALLLIIGGLMSIRSSPFERTDRPAATAAQE